MINVETFSDRRIGIRFEGSRALPYSVWFRLRDDMQVYEERACFPTLGDARAYVAEQLKDAAPQ